MAPLAETRVPGRSPRRDQAAAGAVALLAVAVNLRLAIAAVSPVLPQIQASTGISSTEAGLLTTVPVACFGAFAFVVPGLRRRLGADRLVLALLVLLALGVLARLDARWWPLLLGTVCVGAAIAVGNVVLPVVIRRDFPRRLPLLTGLYSMALAGSAALSAGTVVPLEHAVGGGWAPAVALSGAPIAVAAALWVWTRAPSADAHDHGPSTGTAQLTHFGRTAAGPGMWRSPLAWAVTAFMGLQSLGFYSTLAWTPTLLEHHGMAAGKAGWLLSLSSFVSIGSAIMAPHAARRVRRTTVVGTVALCAFAYIGLALDPVGAAPAWMVTAGIGQGAALSLALGGILERSATQAEATALSTMAQGVGYLLAAGGPLLLGGLRQLSGGWRLPMLALAVLTVPEAVAGLVAVVDTRRGAPRGALTLSGPQAPGQDQGP